MKIVYSDYFIDVDSLNFSLYKKYMKDGKESVFLIGHYSKLINAIKSIAREELAKSKDVVSLNEFLERYVAKVDELTEQIKM